MDSINWFALPWYYYLLGVGAVLTVVALIVYFALGARSAAVRIPAGIIATVTALTAGVGAGVLLMVSMGYRFEGAPVILPAQGQAGDGPMVRGGGMPPPPPMMGAGRGGMGKGGGFAQSPRNQLAALVTKLDLLTAKPLTLELTPEQKAGVREALRGLDNVDELADKDAKERLDKIFELLKGQRATLESAGFRWPGQGFLPPPAEVPNPFKEDGAGKVLRGLTTRLAGGTAP